MHQLLPFFALYIAAAIASRVSERLAVSSLVMQGVDNETVMEEMLAALQPADNFGCFVQGAGI